MSSKEHKEANSSIILQEGREIKEEEKELVIRLKPGIRVSWDEEVVDNEHLGRKSSKSLIFLILI